MAPKRGQAKKEEQVVQLGPQVGAGDNVFCTAHIYASFNDTFVHITDLSGKYVFIFLKNFHLINQPRIKIFFQNKIEKLLLV
jgi:hypothetical protein